MLSYPIETKKIIVGKVPNLYRQESNVHHHQHQTQQVFNSNNHPVKIISMDGAIYINSQQPDSMQNCKDQTTLSIPLTTDMS